MPAACVDSSLLLSISAETMHTASHFKHLNGPGTICPWQTKRISKRNPILQLLPLLHTSFLLLLLIHSFFSPLLLLPSFSILHSPPHPTVVLLCLPPLFLPPPSPLLLHTSSSTSLKRYCDEKIKG